MLTYVNIMPVSLRKMFVTQRRFYAVNFKLVSVKLEELLGECTHLP